MFFKHFTSKNQQSGFYIKGTLVESELIEHVNKCTNYENMKITSNSGINNTI